MGGEGWAGLDGLCQQPGDQLCGRLGLGLQGLSQAPGAVWLSGTSLAVQGTRSWRLPRSGTEARHRGRGRSRAATVKQRPTSRRDHPAEISVSLPGSRARRGRARGLHPLPTAVHVEREGPHLDSLFRGGVKDPKASSGGTQRHSEPPRTATVQRVLSAHSMPPCLWQALCPLGKEPEPS